MTTSQSAILLNFDEEMEKEIVKRVLNNAHVVDCFKAHSAHSFSEGLSIDTYTAIVTGEGQKTSSVLNRALSRIKMRFRLKQVQLV